MERGQIRNLEFKTNLGNFIIACNIHSCADVKHYLSKIESNLEEAQGETFESVTDGEIKNYCELKLVDEQAKHEAIFQDEPSESLRSKELGLICVPSKEGGESERYFVTLMNKNAGVRGILGEVVSGKETVAKIGQAVIDSPNPLKKVVIDEVSIFPS